MPVNVKYCALAIVGVPYRETSVKLSVAEVVKGLTSWDISNIDLKEKLHAFITKSQIESKNTDTGEVLLKYEDADVEYRVLINPDVVSVRSHIGQFLKSPSEHKLLAYGGHVLEGCGEWVLHDGVFSLQDLVEITNDIEVIEAMKAEGEGEVKNTLTLCTFESGPWNETTVAKQPFARVLDVKFNPGVTVPDTGLVESLENFLASHVLVQTAFECLKPSEFNTYIKITKPTVIVFPGSKGDSALFAVKGFAMLVGGGFGNRSTFWRLGCHVDRIDAVLVSHIGTENLLGLNAFLQRKIAEENVPEPGEKSSQEEVLLYSKLKNSPELGVVYVNCPSSRGKMTRNDSSLTVSASNEANYMLEHLRVLNIKPSPCLAIAGGQSVPTLTLYQKVGTGKLDMFVLNPTQNQKELQQFLLQWSGNKTFGSVKNGMKVGGKEVIVPISSYTSICALLIWYPASPSEPIIRVLFPGNAPQGRILDGLDRLKHLECLKHPHSTVDDPTGRKPLKKVEKSEKSSVNSSTNASEEGSHPPSVVNGSACDDGIHCNTPPPEPCTDGIHCNTPPPEPCTDGIHCNTPPPELAGGTDDDGDDELPEGVGLSDDDEGDVSPSNPHGDGTASAVMTLGADSNVHETSPMTETEGNQAMERLMLKESESMESESDKEVSDVVDSPITPAADPSQMLHSAAPFPGEEECSDEKDSPDGGYGGDDLNESMEKRHSPEDFVGGKRRDIDDEIPDLADSCNESGDEGGMSEDKNHANVTEHSSGTGESMPPAEIHVPDNDHPGATTEQADAVMKTSETVTTEHQGAEYEGKGSQAAGDSSSPKGASHVALGIVEVGKSAAADSDAPVTPATTSNTPDLETATSVSSKQKTTTTKKVTSSSTVTKSSTVAKKTDAAKKTSTTTSKVSSATAKSTKPADKKPAVKAPAAKPTAAKTSVTSMPKKAAPPPSKPAAEKKTTTTVTVTKSTSAGAKRPSVVASSNGKAPAKGGARAASAPAAKDAKPKHPPVANPVYLDLTYVPAHGNAKFVNAEFFKRVRARYYVFSAEDRSEAYLPALNALIEGREVWNEADLPLTVVATYETPVLKEWMGRNRRELEDYGIIVAQPANDSKVLMKDETFNAYKLEF